MPSHVVPPLLVAEDDANDMFLFTRLLSAAGAMHALHIALDGREAIRLLTPVAEKRALVARPAIAFIDARMPHIDGFGVLEWIRRQRELDALPVIMMANQADPAEIARAGSLGAQCFLLKFPGKLTMARLLENAVRFDGRDGAHYFDMPDNLLRKRSG